MLLDAYTIRKAIPRIVIAVIGINLSIYLCVAMIDATNVIGGGLGQLITAPFNTSELDQFSVDTGATNSIVAGVGLAVAGPSIFAMIKVFFASLGVAGGAGAAAGGVSVATAGLAALFFIVILPVLLLILGILATIIIRQALLLFLTIISPVAIALFVLPGTEKYFKKWLDLFIKALLVYPIIAVIFAMSDVFGSIIFANNNGTGTMSIARIITGLAVIYAPLFLIPFAFRLAGGAIASLAKVVGGLGDKVGQSGMIKGRQEFYGQKFKDTQTRARAESFRRAKAREESFVGNSAKARLGRRLAQREQRALAGYREDIYQREAEMTKRLAEEQELQKNFGDDTDRRAYGIDIKAARADMSRGKHQSTFTTDSKGRQVETRTSENGMMKQTFVDGQLAREEFRSLGGSWQTEAAVNQAERRFGKRNLGQLQQTLTYEMTKAIEEGQQEGLIERYGQLSQAWGMSGTETQGTWIGPAFNNQQEDLMYKHTKFDEQGKPKVNYASMTREVYEKKGPQMLAYMKGKNIKTLREAHQDAVTRLNNSVVGSEEHEAAKVELNMHEAIMDTLSASRSGGGTVAAAGAGGPAAPAAPTGGATPTVIPPSAGGGAPGDDLSYGWTTGAAHTTDELKQYFDEVKTVAVERAGPGGMAARTRNDTYYDAAGNPLPQPESQSAENGPQNRPR